MAQQDQRAADLGADGAGGAINAATNNMQAIAGEIFDISKQSFEHTTQTLEKLRNAHGMDEVVAIQTNFMKEAFERAAQHARRFGELIAIFPAEITKTYQDAWLKSVNTAVQATETVSQTAAENVDRFSEATRKSASTYDRRESG
jgi:phasin family protein